MASKRNPDAVEQALLTEALRAAGAELSRLDDDTVLVDSGGVRGLLHRRTTWCTPYSALVLSKRLDLTRKILSDSSVPVVAGQVASALTPELLYNATFTLDAPWTLFDAFRPERALQTNITDPYDVEEAAARATMVEVFVLLEGGRTPASHVLTFDDGRCVELSETVSQEDLRVAREALRAFPGAPYGVVELIDGRVRVVDLEPRLSRFAKAKRAATHIAERVLSSDATSSC